MKYTEEEKEVIEVAKKTASKKYGSIMCLEIKDVEIMLNLIEKQQKEIEKQASLIKFDVKYRNQLEQDLYENASNYVISKEKIKDKIKEIEDSLKEDCIALHEFQRLAKIDVLKEILGE